MEKINSDQPNVSLSLAFLFAQWVGERKFTKHQCNDRWYDPDLEYEFVGSTEQLYEMFKKDSDWHKFKNANGG